jgi:hypothetical protein
LRYCGADAGILFEAKRQMSDSKAELHQKTDIIVVILDNEDYNQGLLVPVCRMVQVIDILVFRFTPSGNYIMKRTNSWCMVMLNFLFYYYPLIIAQSNNVSIRLPALLL